MFTHGLLATFLCRLFVWFALTLLLFSPQQVATQSSNISSLGQPEECGGVVRAGSGVISSPVLPGLPIRYPGNLRCEWTVVAARSRRVKLAFFHLDLQPSDQCSADFVEILPGDDSGSSTLSTPYCGRDQTLPPPVLSTGNVLRLRFITDGSQSGAGFSVFYESVRVEPPDPPIIIWLEQNQQDGTAKLQSLPADPADYLTSGSIVTTTLLTYRPANWTTLAVDYHNRDYFWSDPRHGYVWHGVLSGHQLLAEPLYRGTSSAVGGIAVDWLTRTVYWTDAAYNWIMVSDYDGSRRRTVVEYGLENPSGIAVHPSRGWLFWADKGSKPKIERSGLDGRGRQVLVGVDGGFPVGLTVDYPNDRLFWTAHAHGVSRTSSIFSASLDGRGLTEHVRVDYNKFVFSDLTIFKEYLFVTDSTNQLHCYQKNTGVSHYFSLNLGVRRPFGITTNADSNYLLESSGCDLNPCEYVCVGGGGTRHTCLCQSGYHAMPDGTCLRDSDVLIPPPKLFVVTGDSICIYPDNLADMPLPTTGASPGQCILRRLPEAASLAVDVREGRLFYGTTGVDGTVYGVRLRGDENAVAVAGGTGRVRGLAVDWMSRLLYWTDSLLHHIAVARYDGRHRTILLRDDMDQPGPIAVDPRERFIFWSYLGSGSSRVERAGLDGSNRLVILRGVMQPRGITLDFGTKRLYIAERATGTILTVDYTGRGRRKVFGKTGDSMFTGMEMYKDYLFWTEWSPNNELHAVNRVTGEHVRTLPLNGVSEPAHGVAMYAESRQPHGHSACSNDSHGCQQLCLQAPLPSDLVCACSIGYSLTDDGASCTSDLVKDNFILVADAYLHGIFQVDLSTPDPTLQALPLVNVSNPLSVDYDPLLGMVYWSEVTEGTISRALLTGGTQEVILTSDMGEAPYSLVVDSRLLFWTDVVSNSISVCRLDGAYKRTLVNTSASPRALATVPNDGLLFWTWWGEDGAGIGRASMDGQDVHVLLSMEEGFLHSLAVDTQERRVYWTDARAHTIDSMDWDTGGNRRTLPLGVGARPFGLALGVADVYWTDQASRRLMKADRTGANAVTVGRLDLARPNGLHSRARSTMSVVNNACALNNGGCNGLCLPTPNGRTCVCAAGVSVQEDGTCPIVRDPIDINKGLEFTSRPHDVTLGVGMEINQICSSNQPSASVQWKKDFLPLSLGQTGGIYVLSDGALVILDVDETHRGLYTCTVTSTSGDVVEATAEFQFDPEDVFLMTPEPAVVPEGEDHILTCSARSASYVIRWEKNGSPMQLTDMVHVISGDSLVIREALVSDTGKYTCVAQTLGGVRVAEVTAQVTVTSQQVVEDVCGTVTAPEALDGDEEDRTGRITGGTTAKRGSSPWIARVWLNEGRTHYCGGALLNRYWVLTGAHCITEYSVGKEDIRIRLGDHDSYSDEESEQFIGVQHIKVHDEFVDSDYDSDLALVKLAEPVGRFTDYLRPLCLPSKSLARRLLKSGVMGKVAGWGRLVEGGPYPRYLTEVAVPVVGQRKCINSTKYLVTDNMFCAGYKRKKGDACRGDSGGPFAVENKGRWYQLGIVSWGEGCGREGKYGFYTRLVKFLKWINQYMQNH